MIGPDVIQLKAIGSRAAIIDSWVMRDRVQMRRSSVTVCAEGFMPGPQHPEVECGSRRGQPVHAWRDDARDKNVGALTTAQDMKSIPQWSNVLHFRTLGRFFYYRGANFA